MWTPSLVGSTLDFHSCDPGSVPSRGPFPSRVEHIAVYQTSTICNVECSPGLAIEGQRPFYLSSTKRSFGVNCSCVSSCVCTGWGVELNKCVHPQVVTVPVQVKNV